MPLFTHASSLFLVVYEVIYDVFILLDTPKSFVVTDVLNLR